MTPQPNLQNDALKPALAESLVNTRFNGLSIRNIRATNIHQTNPESRQTIRYGLTFDEVEDSVNLIGKWYGNSREGQFIFDAMRRLYISGFDFHAPDRIRIPEPLVYDKTLSLLLMEDVPFPSLSKLLTSCDPTGYLHLAAKSMEKLHTTSISVDRRINTPIELKELDTSAGKTKHVAPDVARSLSGHLEYLHTLAARIEPNRTTLIHGSFQPGHLLCSERQLVLIDFDNLALGPPEKDSGRFLGYLRFLGFKHDWDDEKTRFFGRAFAHSNAERSNSSRIVAHFYYQSTVLRIMYRRLRSPDNRRHAHRMREMFEDDLWM